MTPSLLILKQNEMKKAIETTYKGYRFRSRLEARWAVFFDSLGYAWEYEKEGYELPSGRYLPDFYLPDYETWVEIKGESFSEIEKTKCLELAHSTEKYVIMCTSVPEMKAYPMIFPSQIDLKKFNYCSFSPYHQMKKWTWFYQSCDEQDHQWDANNEKHFDAARSARFEYLFKNN